MARVSTYATKSTLADNDSFVGPDSADSNKTKRWLWSAIKTALGFTAASSSSATSMKFYEDTDNGSNYVDLIAPTALVATRTATLPSVTGTILSTGNQATPAEAKAWSAADADEKVATVDSLRALLQTTTVASDTTIHIGDGLIFLVTGTTTIDDIIVDDHEEGRMFILVFDGTLILNAGGGASYTTLADDWALFRTSGAGTGRIMHYQRDETVNSGELPVVAGGTGADTAAGARTNLDVAANTWTVVSSASASVSPAASDTGKYYRLSDSNPTFNLPTTSLVVGKTEFWLTLTGASGPTGSVDAGSGKTVDYQTLDIPGAVAPAGAAAQTTPTLITFQLFHIKYVATNTWASNIICSP